MGLKRVSRFYLADDSGLRGIGAASAVAAAAMSAAGRIAASAQALGKGTYSVRPAVVTAGWANERRMGAVVRETRHDFRDSRDAVLLTVLSRMAIRGGDGPSSSDQVVYTRRDGSTRMATRAQAANWSRGRRG